MKVQVFILLGLMCFSALTCTTSPTWLSTTASLSGTTYQIGSEGMACCIKAGTAAAVAIGTATAGTCVPKLITVINSKIWFVLATTGLATPLDTTTAGSYTAITPVASIAAGAFAIGQVEVAAPQTTVKGSYIAAKTDATTWAAFTASAAEVCSTTFIQIRGSSAANLLSAADATMGAVTGNGVYYVYDTATATLTSSATTPKCRATLTSPSTNSKQTLGTTEITLGAAGDECCVQTTTSQRCYTSAATGAKCVPKALLKVDSDVWAVLQVNAAANYIDAYTTPTTGFVDTNLPKASLVDNSVAIVKLDTAATDAGFGKFSASTHFAAKDGTTWSGFAVTAATYCSDDKVIQVTGTTSGSATLLDAAGAAVAVAKGTGAHLGFTPSTMKATGVAPDNEWCTNGASILSIASVVLAFFGLVSL